MSENSETELTLLPCPFCGAAVKMSRHKGSDETGERWDYLSVECRGKDHNVLCDSGDTAEEVAAAWNRRPLPAEGRRLGLEEAAKVADALAAELARLKGSSDRRVQIGSHLETCATIAAAIRALSLQVE